MKSVNIKHIAKFSHPKHQRGASLLEGIAYLGVAALIVLGAVSLLNNASSSAKANQTQSEITGLRTAIKKLYAGQSYPANGNLVPVLSGANAIPTTLVVANPGAAGASIKNAWNGDVTIATTPTTFTITYKAVPGDVCINTLSGASGWTSIKGVANAATALAGRAMPAADAAAQCAGATVDMELVAS